MQGLLPYRNRWPWFTLQHRRCYATNPTPLLLIFSVLYLNNVTLCCFSYTSHYKISNGSKYDQSVNSDDGTEEKRLEPRSSSYLFSRASVEQKHQAALFWVDPHELQKDAVYPHPLRYHQQPVTAEQTEEHLGLKLQQRSRHVQVAKSKISGARRTILCPRSS